MENTDNKVVEQCKIVSFLINGEKYGFFIDSIIEIINIQTIFQLPQMKPFIKGVINLRGNIVPIISLRMKLGFEEIPPNELTKMIIAKYNDENVGIIVDEVLKISSYDKNLFKDAANYSFNRNDIRLEQILTTHESEIIGMLNFEHILSY